VTAEAPSASYRKMYYGHPENVFYGTDDGAQDGSFREFAEFRAHYESVDPARRDNIHMISVVGGLYGLNLIPLWKPKKLTIFDVNPTAITYFRLIHRAWTTSNDAAQFLQRLTDGDYEAFDDEEEFVRENIQLRRKDALPRERGSSKRSYEESWQYALEHFDVTKKIMLESQLELRGEPMESDSFREFIRGNKNIWIYASNITEFHYFDLDFEHPDNAVVLQIIHPEQPQLLDLAPHAGSPVKVKFEIPLKAEPLAHPPVSKSRIATNAAPPATGTFSQAIRTGNLVFLAGQTGRNPETGELEEGLEAQTHRMLSNIDAVLNAAGCTPADIVKVTLLMADIKDFKAIDAIYAAWLPGRGITPLPARTAFAALGLPAGARVMLDVVAAAPKGG
jgi:2-iminobutanoate/2-iminopropanoate deaminase